MSHDQELKFLPVTALLPNPDQPRQVFDEDAMRSLADSIKVNGIRQPLNVRGPYEEGSAIVYIIIDGERRWRAAKECGLNQVPCLIELDAEKKNDLVMATVANLQRANMNPMEEGLAYQKLRGQGYSVDNIAEMVGRSGPGIYMRLKIAEFEPEIQKQFAAGSLPLDTRAIKAISDLPADVRVKVAVGLGMRKATISNILRTCWRMSNRSDDAIPSDPYPKTVVPVMALTAKEKPTPMLKVLTADGDRMPPWPVIEAAAKATCDECSIRSNATYSLCRDCPAVELIKRIRRQVGR